MSRDTGYTVRGSASTSGALQEPTEAQRAWTERLERLLGELEALERDGRRLRAARLDAPEAVLLRWLVPRIRAGLDTLQAARDLGRTLEIGRDPQGCPSLRVASASANVIQLAIRRQGSEHGPQE